MSWHCLTSNKPTKCRKPTRCLLCNGPIAKGETYILRTGVESGEGYVSMQMHPECEKASSSWDSMDWECFSPGDMERPTANQSPNNEKQP